MTGSVEEMQAVSLTNEDNLFVLCFVKYVDFVQQHSQSGVLLNSFIDWEMGSRGNFFVFI